MKLEDINDVQDFLTYLHEHAGKFDNPLQPAEELQQNAELWRIVGEVGARGAMEETASVWFPFSLHI